MHLRFFKADTPGHEPEAEEVYYLQVGEETTTLTCWQKFHDFYLPSQVFSDKGNIRRGSRLAKIRFAAANEAKPAAARQIEMASEDTTMESVVIDDAAGTVRGRVQIDKDQYQGARGRELEGIVECHAVLLLLQLLWSAPVARVRARRRTTMTSYARIQAINRKCGARTGGWGGERQGGSATSAYGRGRTRGCVAAAATGGSALASSGVVAKITKADDAYGVLREQLGGGSAIARGCGIRGGRGGAAVAAGRGASASVS
ncbi:hypothetical protein PHYPSEUDO_006604 [Phytophthora pseudosyringae]|uniref:Uncharacterized protein n=1 Tax=Phytophthora pseudosyringae TaxID=221518 RepID=A0A8T1VL96_9STRA|nr:hypothetical protein PHYPSEUDO_006604 [Phytophthora pseudosyringae]